MKYPILLLLLASCSPKIVEKAIRQKNPVTIDANSSEYGRMRFYSPEAKMLYTISNDGHYLYLCFRTADEAMQRQILLSGMEIRLGTKTKSAQQISIKYPLKNNEPPAFATQTTMNEKRQPDPAQFRQRFLLNQKVAEVKGFKDLPDGLCALETEQGFKAAVGWDTADIFIYELQVPLKSWYRNVLLSDSSRVFSLTVTVDAPSLPSGGPRGGPPDGDRPAGMGHGNGPPGGRKPPGDAPGFGPPPASEPRSFSTNFKLNTNEN